MFDSVDYNERGLGFDGKFCIEHESVIIGWELSLLLKKRANNACMYNSFKHLSEIAIQFFNMPICVLLEFMSNTKAGCLNRSGLTSDHIKRRDILENVEMNMILHKLSILIVQNKPNNVRPMIIAITYV